MDFNPKASFKMHIDINSAFATIEQQENPSLRGHPLVVAAFTTPNGCILASSIEAKRLGIKTGMSVGEGMAVYPKLKVLPSDPPKYRRVHMAFRKLLSTYTNDLTPKSIDEFVLNLEDYPCLRGRTMFDVAREIKGRIKVEVGDWISVSIGISTNRYLAKVAAGLVKPDGLSEINKDNCLSVYSKLKLTDLTGIKVKSAMRLASIGVYSPLDFFNSPSWKLKSAFSSITGLYWHYRLHGYEIDDVAQKRGSYGNSVALGKNLSTVSELSPILARLTEKMAGRVRAAGYTASGVHLSLSFKKGGSWSKGRIVDGNLFQTKDFFKYAYKLLLEADPKDPVHIIAVSVFNLTRFESSQLELFSDVARKRNLTTSLDLINNKHGDYTVGLARSFTGENIILDRIAFGGIKEL